jgi:hypothetical protein
MGHEDDERCQLCGRPNHQDALNDITPTRIATLDDNPALACTLKQLTFAAWQKAAGGANLVESGPAWESFSTWWEANAGLYATVRDVCAMAWAESSARQLEAWWRDVVASQPRR